jgi:hypothetical protein
MDLLNELYEDVGLRPMTDIDLCVSKKDYEEIVRILETQGYERDAVYPGTFKQGNDDRIEQRKRDKNAEQNRYRLDIVRIS